ncbi:MAG: alpha/beta fold hydrolase [Dermatophilaceae bacterium]|nr:alpha/beta fold hydrolase [Dermatophilaceae bacterium]
MRGLRRGRVPAQGNGAVRRHDLLSRLLAPFVSLAILAGLLLLAAAPVTGPAGEAPATTATSRDASDPLEGEDGEDGEEGGDRPSTTKVSFQGPVDPEPAALAAFYGKPVRWQSCRDHSDPALFDCGTVRVPVDYGTPAGAVTTIALKRLRAASPEKRIGSLFINPGGPGGSGIDFADEAPDFFGDDVLDRYDVVGFDPRGMGESDPVECFTDAELDAMYAADPTPDTDAEKAAARLAPAQQMRRCLARGGALAAHMGTEAVARDLDVLRSAVGDERLNYYGVSYGTMIGAIYADFFTSRVGLMVLDSAVLPDALVGEAPTQDEIDDEADSWASDFEDVLGEFVDECGSSIECPLGADVEAVTNKLVAFLDRLDQHPLETGYDSLPRLTEGWASTAIGWGLQEPDSWPDLVDALDLAVNEDDAEDLARFAMRVTERDENGTYAATTFGRSHLLVTCADWPRTPWDSTGPSPDVLDAHPLWSRVEPPGVDPCTGWTGAARETLLVGAEVATPVLVIGNDGDRTTPMEGTEGLAAEIVRSRLVTVEAEGHGAYGNGDDCADGIVDDYLARHLAPENDFICES